MEENALQTIDIQRILSLAPVIDEHVLGKDIILGEVHGEKVGKSEGILKMLQYPVRFDGYIFFFLKEGHFQVDHNLNTFDVRSGSIMMTVPGNIVKVSSYKPEHIADAELYFLLISKEFMSGIHLDINRVYQESLRLWNYPCIRLSEDDISLLVEYFTLSRNILHNRIKNKKNVLGALVTSFAHVILELWTREINHSRKAENPSTARINQLLERFIALVTEYHNTERGVAFYADKLCLSPKYLSKLIKQASGRSAPAWIDSFVILEAKNLLKYSDKSVKQIVYDLHFPNQSVFYKFFKTHTGMTPSQYRKG